MKTLAAHGIILRRTDYGEADRIITFLTRDHGRIRVMAKGVRKSKSKLAGGIELFSVSEIHFIKGRSEIGTLVSTRLVRHYGRIVKDLERTQLAYAMLKSIDRTVEDTAGAEYFDVLHESLAALDSDGISPLLAELSFTMRILQLLGHVPDFSSDSQGNKLDPEAAYEFDFEKTAFVVRPDGPFHKNHIKLLKLLAYNRPQVLAGVQGGGAYAQAVAPLVRALASQSLTNLSFIDNIA